MILAAITGVKASHLMPGLAVSVAGALFAAFSADDWIKIIGAIVSGTMLILGVLLPFFIQLRRVAKDSEKRSLDAEHRSNTAMDFILRRGRVEAENLGLYDPHADTVTAKVDAAYAVLLPRFQEIALATAGQPTTELVMQLEDEFGPVLMKRICPALKVSQGACLYFAVRYIRPGFDGSGRRQHPCPLPEVPKA